MSEVFIIVEYNDSFLQRKNPQSVGGKVYSSDNYFIADRMLLEIKSVIKKYHL